MYHIFFFLRRYVMLLILTVLSEYAIWQINVHLMSTVFIISYIFSQRPYEEPWANLHELLNECFIFAAAYPLFAFTDWVSDLDARYNYGWFIVGVICLNVLFNMIVATVLVISDACKKLKIYLIRRRKLQEFKARHLQYLAQVSTNNLTIKLKAKRKASTGKNGKNGKK